MTKPEQAKIISAQTFTPVYDELEDRIRLSINYQDVNNRIDFLITRNLIINLLPSIEEFMTRHYDYEDTQETITTQKMSNDEVEENKILSKTNSANFALNLTIEDLLVKVDLSFDKNTQHTLLFFTSKKNHKAQAVLDKNLLLQIIKIIKSSIPTLKWGISTYF